MRYLYDKEKIGKKLVDAMMKYRKSEDQYFVDLFCGGCNVIKYVTGKRIANDMNKYIISMWVDLMKGRKFPQDISPEIYNEARRDYYNGKTKYDDGMLGWIMYSSSFKGYGFNGGFCGTNVRHKKYNRDKYINIQQFQINKILSDLKMLGGVSWYRGDYRKIPIPDNSIIYCDIPYKSRKTRDEWSKKFDYESFYEWCREMDDKGHKIFVSEYEMPDDFRIVWWDKPKELYKRVEIVVKKLPRERLFTLKLNRKNGKY